jgi:Protein of unknown function (DUF2764)
MRQKREYHYLVAGLPDIVIDQGKVNLKVADFKQELREHLHPDDFQLVEMLFLRFDNLNLLNLLQKSGEPWDAMGNFSEEQMIQGLDDPSVGLPSYMPAFAAAYREATPIVGSMTWENQLASRYYEYLLSNTEGFLHEWFTFDRNIKNLLTAISVRRHGLLLSGQLVGQNDVTDAIQKSHARDFGLVNECPYIERLLKIVEQPDILEQERDIAHFKWDYLEDLNTFNYFTIDKILGFLLKLISYERWAMLEPAEGKAIFKGKIASMEHSLEFPKEFSV